MRPATRLATPTNAAVKPNKNVQRFNFPPLLQPVSINTTPDSSSDKRAHMQPITCNSSHPTVPMLYSIRSLVTISAKFDMIVALINIFRQASILRIPAHEPIGQYRQKNSNIVCLHDKDVRDILCAGCIQAYTNPLHYCRLNITGIVAHSNPVTAALCLYLGGATIDEIAFWFCWEPGSVPMYLRECFIGIDAIMRKGAYLTV
jgi:hypothetical protein